MRWVQALISAARPGREIDPDLAEPDDRDVMGQVRTLRRLAQPAEMAAVREPRQPARPA